MIHSVPTQANDTALDAVFGALADPTRRSILSRLRDRAMTVGEVAEAYPVSLNAISKHLKALERAGLIRREISGREHCCRLEAGGLETALTWMRDYSQFWNDRVEALSVHIAKKRKRSKS